MLQNYFTFLLMDKNNLLENSHTLKHSVLLSPGSSSNNRVGIKPTHCQI